VGLLENFYDDGWFYGQEKRLVLIRYYSVVNLPRERLSPVPSVERISLSGDPFRLVLAEISDQSYVTREPRLVSNEDGSSRIVVEATNRVLPSTLYALVSAPLLNLEAWEETSRRMGRVAALIRANFGRNFLYELVREAIVEIPSGNMTHASPVVPFPQSFDGPYIEPDRWRALEEILAALDAKQPQMRSRVLSALELFEKGSEETGGLKAFFYWVAAEVLCNTDKSACILDRLSKAYAVKRGFVQNYLGFDLIKDLRTDLIHHGLTHDFPQDVEKYIQSMFMDLLRFHLGLDCHRLMEAEIIKGFVVERLRRDIGLANVISFQGKEPSNG
jgi:hypothetical protein